MKARELIPDLTCGCIACLGQYRAENQRLLSRIADKDAFWRAYTALTTWYQALPIPTFAKGPLITAVPGAWNQRTGYRCNICTHFFTNENDATAHILCDHPKGV